MRARVILVLFAILSSSTVMGQDEKVTLPSSRLTVAEAVKQIESQTRYTLAYNNHIVDSKSQIIVNNTEPSVKEIVEKIVSGKELSYMLSGKYIIINPVKAEKVVPVKVTYNDGYVTSNPDSLNSTQLRRPLKVEEKKGEPKPVAINAPVVPNPYSAYEPVDRYSGLINKHPLLAVKTNLLYTAATLTPNLAAEIGLGEKSTLEISGSYNPWNRIGTPENNKKLVHWTVRPEYRYWLCERFDGHFFGANAFFTKYNVGGYNIPFTGFKKEYRYEGHAIGAGIAYGYHLPIHPKWSLEFSVSAGVAYTKYEKFDCLLCSGVIEEKSRLYVGPTRAAVSLVFMIK